jgi:hypothetical protein
MRLKKIAQKSPQLPKKVVTYLRHFFFFFLGSLALSFKINKPPPPTPPP